MSGVLSRKSAFVAVFLSLALLCAGAVDAAVVSGCAYADSGSLVACSAVKTTQAKTSKASKAKKAFAGKWKLCKLKQNGEVTSEKDLNRLKKLGLVVTLNLKKNGKAVLDLFGDKSSGTWKASSAKRGWVKLQSEKVTMKKSGKTLVMSDEGAALYFKR